MTLPKIFLAARERPLDHKALLYKREGEWRSYNWKQYFAASEGFAHHLIGLDVKPGDRVAIFSETRPEWAITDLAIQCMGAITVPVYANGNSDELAHVLNNSGACVLIIDSKKQIQKWQEVGKECPGVRHVLSYDDGSWDKAVVEGTKAASKNPREIPARIEKTQIDDIATIVYTSGTSGAPKGVILTQRQVVSEVTDITKTFNVDHRDQTLSFLPYAHVLGRVEMWLSVHAGFTLGFAESIERIRNNLTEIPPTVIISVPRIFEKIYGAISGQLERRPMINRFFEFAGKISPSISQWLKGKLLAAKIKPAFGGRLRFAISGGAPLSPDIAMFFRAAGIPAYEGYGLTETTAAITVNTPDHHRYGSVGRPLPEVKVKIAEDGEILVKSDKIMAGYYQQDSATAFVDDHYFATGDIGHVDSDGYLFITDRKKDLIKTSGGKYVAPQKLENALKANTLISQALIHGDKQKYVVALITLTESDIARWAKEKNLKYGSYKDLSQSNEVKELVSGIVAKANEGLAGYESIKKFAVLDHDFTVADGELTPSLKLKRKFCEQKYAKILESLYQ